MWRFKAEQKRFQIGGVSVGGQPGERPTVLVGSLFYAKHIVVVDAETGEFDREEAERQLNVQDELSDRTGLPCMLDVIASTPKAMERFLSFALETSERPILIDGSTHDVRISGVELAEQWGVSDRVVYNSITPEFKQTELEKIQEAKIRSCVILAYTSTDFTSRGRVKAVKELIPKVEAYGVTKPLIDTCVIDVPSLGSASRALVELKDELGLPVGNGSHNAISTWRGLASKFSPDARRPGVAAAAAVTAAVGGDFCLYGPVNTAPYVFPAVAMVNAAQEQLGFEDRLKLDRSLPLFKIG